MRSGLAAVTLVSLALTACSDSPTAARRAPSDALNASAATGAGTTAGIGSTVRWNRKAIAIGNTRLNGGIGRTNAYLSIAQYRAVLAANQIKQGSSRPSLAGAAAGASVVVLSQFYPLDVADINAELTAQKAGTPAPNDESGDFAAGEALGRSIGASVLAWAATDKFGATEPGAPPVGAGFWVSSGAPTVRGGFGARPFFLTKGSELRPPPPPTFGSTAFLSALAEVRSISDARTPAQVAITLKWVPFSGVIWNGVAADLIVRYQKPEIEAARILAYGNAAAYDAIVGCFDAKFTYWFVRPTQADPLITTATALPNHPSYPSAHSCETGAWYEVLTTAFPGERASLGSTAEEASFSRVLGGLHYRFDGQVGLALGRGAGRLGLQRKGLE